MLGHAPTVTVSRVSPPGACRNAERSATVRFQRCRQSLHAGAPSLRSGPRVGGPGGRASAPRRGSSPRVGSTSEPQSSITSAIPGRSVPTTGRAAPIASIRTSGAPSPGAPFSPLGLLGEHDHPGHLVDLVEVVAQPTLSPPMPSSSASRLSSSSVSVWMRSCGPAMRTSTPTPCRAQLGCRFQDLVEALERIEAADGHHHRAASLAPALGRPQGHARVNDADAIRSEIIELPGHRVRNADHVGAACREHVAQAAVVGMVVLHPDQGRLEAGRERERVDRRPCRRWRG